MQTIGLIGGMSWESSVDYYRIVNEVVKKELGGLHSGNGIQVICRELCLGVLGDVSRRNYLQIISELADQGAEGVILGCTEIGLLVNQRDTLVPLFDTTKIHAERAALKSLE